MKIFCRETAMAMSCIGLAAQQAGVIKAFGSQSSLGLALFKNFLVTLFIFLPRNQILFIIIQQPSCWSEFHSMHIGCSKKAV